jgi:predicted transcriptional regulator
MCRSQVSELLSDWEDDGHIVRRKRGNKKSIELRRFDA